MDWMRPLPALCTDFVRQEVQAVFFCFSTTEQANVSVRAAFAEVRPIQSSAPARGYCVFRLLLGAGIGKQTSVCRHSFVKTSQICQRIRLKNSVPSTVA